MRRKVTNFALVLDVHAVTCPGVWLCPNGNVSVKITLFNEVAETKSLAPVFPILYHEKFTFQKLFPDVYFLTELQNTLKKEMMDVEFLQWPSSGSEILLASFHTNLLDLLYPSAGRKTTEVDLLMDPSDAFPGILTPKVEMSTRTTVEEIPLTEVELYDASTSILQNSLKFDLDRSVQHSIREPIKRQRKVCHSLGVHEKKGNCTFIQPQPKHQKSGKLSPFSIRNVDTSVNTYESFLNSTRKPERKKDTLNSTALVHWTSVSGSSSCSDDYSVRRSSTVNNRRNSTKIDSDSSFSRGEISIIPVPTVNRDIKDKKTGAADMKFMYNEPVINARPPGVHSCLLCSQYESFFEDKKSRQDT